MSLYIDESVSKILTRLEESIKEVQNDITRLDQTLDNNESPAAVIDSLQGGCEDHLSYCRDIRAALDNIKAVL